MQGVMLGEVSYSPRAGRYLHGLRNARDQPSLAICTDSMRRLGMISPGSSR
jgi:hypothetical protein